MTIFVSKSDKNEHKQRLVPAYSQLKYITVMLLKIVNNLLSVVRTEI